MTMKSPLYRYDLTLRRYRGKDNNDEDDTTTTFWRERQDECPMEMLQARVTSQVPLRPRQQQELELIQGQFWKMNNMKNRICYCPNERNVNNAMIQARKSKVAALIVAQEPTIKPTIPVFCLPDELLLRFCKWKKTHVSVEALDSLPQADPPQPTSRALPNRIAESESVVQKQHTAPIRNNKSSLYSKSGNVRNLSLPTSLAKTPPRTPNRKPADSTPTTKRGMAFVWSSMLSFVFESSLSLLFEKHESHNFVAQKQQSHGNPIIKNNGDKSFLDRSSSKCEDKTQKKKQVVGNNPYRGRKDKATMRRWPKDNEPPRLVEEKLDSNGARTVEDVRAVFMDCPHLLRDTLPLHDRLSSKWP